jgi:hypothetical protein
MQPYQKRVVEEKEQLDEKIKKLQFFIVEGDIFPNLPTTEKRRLHDQLEIMRRLSMVLLERIEAFEA